MASKKKSYSVINECAHEYPALFVPEQETLNQFAQRVAAATLRELLRQISDELSKSDSVSDETKARLHTTLGPRLPIIDGQHRSKSYGEI